MSDDELADEVEEAILALKPDIVDWSKGIADQLKAELAKKMREMGYFNNLEGSYTVMAAQVALETGDSRRMELLKPRAVSQIHDEFIFEYNLGNHEKEP